MYPTHPLLMLAVGNERRNDMLRAAQAHRLATAASSEAESSRPGTDRPETDRRGAPGTRVSASTRILSWSRLQLRHP